MSDVTRGSDLGWWGDHPYVYVAFTSGGALASWAFVLVAATTTREAAIGFALCGGLFVVLLTIAAVYAWHWLLVGRHRDRVANDRMRWAWDKALLRAGWVFLWLIFLGLIVLTSVGFYTSWRLDRYGEPAAAAVTAVHGTSITLAVTTPDGDRVGAWSMPRGSEPVAAMRRRINRRALHRWSSDVEPIEAPQRDRGRSQPGRRRRRRK